MLADTAYGKSGVRLVQVTRPGDRHAIRDLTVSVKFEGDYDGCYADGNNADVLPTDTMKNTVYAFAREHGVGQPEAFALRLGRHFVATQPQIQAARVTIESYGWERLGPHSFRRKGDFTRLCVVTVGEEPLIEQRADHDAACSAAALRARSRDPEETRGWSREAWPIEFGGGTQMHCIAGSQRGETTGTVIESGR